MAELYDVPVLTELADLLAGQCPLRGLGVQQTAGTEPFHPMGGRV